MKHPRKDYDRIQDPAGLIPEDEPVLLIRGQDKAAPAALRAYAEFAMQNGADHSVADAVLLHAEKMEAWQRDHISKIPDVPEGMLVLAN